VNAALFFPNTTTIQTTNRIIWFPSAPAWIAITKCESMIAFLKSSGIHLNFDKIVWDLRKQIREG